MPSDREIEAAIAALEEKVPNVLPRPYRRRTAELCLSAAATARPDWEAIARELYEALDETQRRNAALDEGQFNRRLAALKSFERASLGEGEGGR